MSASGNDFIVLENMRPNKVLIQKMCTRHTGIGADGVLVLLPSKKAEFKMRIFNPDGSEAEMCGNGIRCISLYAWKKKFVKKRFSIETLAGIIKANIISKNNVRVFLNSPKNIKLNLNIRYKGAKIHTVNTGVPHAIIFVADINKADVLNTGRAIRHHRQFQPKGVNVDFVQIIGKNRIAVRTYERGVEAETLSCGTGVTASAVISRLARKLQAKIKVHTRSGDILEIDTEKMSLEGPVYFVFEGRVNAINRRRL